MIVYSEDHGFCIAGPDRSLHPIENCPWCGDVLPQHVGDGPIAPTEEYARISDRASTIRRPEECYAVFGEPDYDKPFPDDKGMPTDLRNIEYYNISDWYTLEFYFQDPNYCGFSIHAKPIPLRKTTTSRHPPEP